VAAKLVLYHKDDDDYDDDDINVSVVWWVNWAVHAAMDAKF
jgi:hypothetical protein